jgi:hypothetical protein
MSSRLERALLCERVGWRILPHEMDDLPLELSRALHELATFRAYQQYARDLEKLTAEEAEIVGLVEKIRGGW